MTAPVFEVGNRFLEKLRNGQLKTVDLALWRELPLGLEKPLYHFLDKNFYQKSRYEIGLCKLAKRIALTGKYDNAQRRRKIEKPLRNLLALDFLAEFRLIGPLFRIINDD